MTPPVAINGVSYGKVVNGVTTKQALAAANETVSKGVYDATTLSAVDADLAVGNIINTATIFGKVGTAVPGGTETNSRVGGGTLNGTAWTPASSGVYSIMIELDTQVRAEYYSTSIAQWIAVPGPRRNINGIDDGGNFRVNNLWGGPVVISAFKQYYSTGTYERLRDTTLAAGATYTPAVSGIFATANSNGDNTCRIEVEQGGSWYPCSESVAVNNSPLSLAIGDGTNLRVKNTHGATTYTYVLMHQKLT